MHETDPLLTIGAPQRTGVSVVALQVQVPGSLGVADPWLRLGMHRWVASAPEQLYAEMVLPLTGDSNCGTGCGGM